VAEDLENSIRENAGCRAYGSSRRHALLDLPAGLTSSSADHPVANRSNNHRSRHHTYHTPGERFHAQSLWYRFTIILSQAFIGAPTLGTTTTDIACQVIPALWAESTLGLRPSTTP